MKILAIIPARGGSKGIAGKNIVELNGYPLIYYTIKEALKVDTFDKLFVSTDSDEIKEVCESFGCIIPFLRPSKLSQDNSRSIDAVIDVLESLKSDYNEVYDFVCLLQPTSPLRTAKDIINCIDILRSEECSSVVSVTKIDEPHPFKMKVIKENMIFPFLEGTDSSVPRQELPDVFALNGAIYLTDTRTIIENKSFFSEKTYPYFMPYERSVNINNSYDLEIAKSILKNEKNN